MKNNIGEFLIISILGLFLGCSTSTTAALEPIGGYNSADDIESSNLVAYWGFNGTATESKSNSSPITGGAINATYVTGVKGAALNLSSGYLYYTNAALSTPLSSFTISAWVNVANNGVYPTVLLSLAKATPGNTSPYINFTASTDAVAISNNIIVQGEINSTNSLASQTISNIAVLDATMQSFNSNPANLIKHVAYPNEFNGQWFHTVISWNETTGKFKVYANGTKISDPAAEQKIVSALSYPTTAFPIIGANSAYVNTTGTTPNNNQAMTGKIDEMRVYKIALSDDEINSLYQLERVGR